MEIGAFFRGHQVKVSGKIPQGAQAVMEVLGQTGDEHLMRKGRRGGLWMNVGEIEVQGPRPSTWSMSTSPKLLEDPPAEAPWGYAGPEAADPFGPGQVSQEEPEFFWTSFSSSRKARRFTPPSQDPSRSPGRPAILVPVKGEFRLPTNVKPGTYRGLPHGGPGRPGNRQEMPRPEGGHGGVSGHAGLFGL